MNQLLDINGSLKEYAEDIESRMNRAFNSRAGKKYRAAPVTPKLVPLTIPEEGNFFRVKTRSRAIE